MYNSDHRNLEQTTDYLGRKVKTYRGVRSCRLCKTPLSNYNPNNYCWAHTVVGEDRKFNERVARQSQWKRKNKED